MKSNRLGRGQTCYALSAAADSGTTPISTPVLVTDVIDALGLQCVTTGTLAGAWTVTASNDYIASPAGEAGLASQATGTFSPYTGFTFAAVSSGGSSQYVEKSGFCPRAIIVTFTPTSGTGTVTLIYFGKGNR